MFGAHAAFAAAILTIGCGGSGTARKSEVRVAAAANLTEVFQKAGPQFEAETLIHPVFSFGSTGQLAQQIENSAPFDLIAAADSRHLDALQNRGLLAPGSRVPYAQGVLALWVPPNSRAAVDNINGLSRPDVRVIAIAKPELAPYGLASVEALRRAGIWERVKSKIVYAENISMAKQYGVSGNADAVFTAYSLVFREQGRILTVPENLYDPIRQELAIIAGAANAEQARRFATFLTAGKGREVLRAYGYRSP